MPRRDIAKTVVQYGVQTATSKTILVVTDDLAEAERMLDMLGDGVLIQRTVEFGRWTRVDSGLPATG